MFGRKDDILGADERPERDLSRPEVELNREVDLVVKANSFTSAVFPKPGRLVVGDGGVEFLADSGVGFIQIPWGSVEEVAVDVVAGHYVRAVRISTNECAPLEFVVSDGQNLVRSLAAHIGRDRLVAAPNAVKAGERAVRSKIGRLLHRDGDGA